MSKEQPTDLELLATRAEGLVDRSIGVRFDHCAAKDALGITPAVPAHLVPALEATWNGVRRAGAPTTSPPPLAECERLLVAEGWNVRVGEVSLVYLIDPGVAFTSEVTMHRSDRVIPSWLRQANPGNWEPIEWDELIGGKLGPWAMATHEERVVSITHAPTPLTDRSVEAGAWTHPEFRGRGYAAAVTAEWADVLRPSRRLLFYSTGRDNVSSQKVATQLGSRLIGYQWLLHNRDLEPEPESEGGAHPLSALRGLGGSRVPTSTTQRTPQNPGVIQPIETSRLLLESMSTEFLSAFLDGDTGRAQQSVDYRVPPDFSLLGKRASVERRLGQIAADRSQHPWMYRAILRKSDRALIGHVSFHHKAPDPDLRPHGETGAELAYTVEPAHRRRGYAKESAIGMMEWASREFGVRSFVLTISPHNLPSLKTAESMGFRVIGEQEDPTDGTELVMKAEIELILQSKDALRHAAEPLP